MLPLRDFWVNWCFFVIHPNRKQYRICSYRKPNKIMWVITKERTSGNVSNTMQNKLFSFHHILNIANVKYSGVKALS